jgi:fibronectin-binding autotransporter adhesin
MNIHNPIDSRPLARITGNLTPTGFWKLTLKTGVILFSVWIGMTSASRAQTNYYWDTSATGGIQTGSGNWTTTDVNWNDASNGGGTRTVWLNGGGNNIANISGNTQTITVNGTVNLGQLFITGTANTFADAGSGVLDFGSNAGLINNANAISSFNVGLAGSNGITKSGAGSLTYIGTGSYTGALTVSGGAFNLGNTTPTTNRLLSTSALVIGSSTTAGTFTMVAATAGTNAQTFTNLGVGAGLNTLSSSGASAANMAAVTFGGNYTRSNNGVLSLTNATGFNATANFTNNNDGTNVIDGVLVGANRSNNTFVANNNTANGAPTTANNTWSTGTHTVATSNNGSAYTGTTASLRLSGTRTVTLADGAVINTGMIANNGGSATGLITGGTLTSGNGRDLILIGGDSAYRTEIASQIVDNGVTSIGLLVANAGGANGNLISGNNTYTGNTTLVSQLTVAGHNNAFGTGTIVFAGGNLAGSIGSNRVLSNNVSMLVNGGLNVLNQTGVSPFGGAGTSYDLTLAGNISGAGNLSLNNSVAGNTVTLSGNNSGHTGQVIVNNAATTLALGSANAIGSGGVNLATAGTVTSSDTTARSVNIANYTAAGATFGRAGTGNLNVNMAGLGAIAYNINVGNDLTTITNPVLATGAGATLTKNGNGTLALDGDFSLFGSAVTTGLTINAGSVQVGTGGTTGSLAITGAVANVNGTGGSLAFNRSDAITFGTAITGAVGVQQKGSGNTRLTATNTYTGATAISGGTLLIDTTGSINGTSAVSIATGATLKYNSNTAYTGGAITNNGTISGVGSLNVAVALDSLTDVLAPGNSPGIQTYGANQTWTSFTYEWETNDFNTLTAGTTYDQIAITGSLTLDGSSYALDILSLTGGNLAGLVPDFSETNTQWTILTTTGGLSGFVGSEWAIDPSGFQNAELGTFTLSADANNLYLNYTVIPEPSTYALLGLGLAGLLALRRRCKS